MMLQTKFGQLCQPTIRKLFQQEVLRVVGVYYDQPHRAYHNMSHIHQMFTDAEYFDWELSCEEILAIAYHDIIWVASDDAGSVRASANLLKKHQEQGILNQTASVLDMDMEPHKFRGIIDGAASAIHDTHQHFNHCEMFDSGRVIDLDMFGFSQSQRQPEITKNLSYEYGPRFVAGRVAFLQTFLMRTPFYYFLDGSYSRLAYTNILTEINDLIGDTDVGLH